jgi:nicotinamidase-related amidase
VSDTDLVVVGTYLNQFVAETVRSVLEAAGIDSMIRSDDCGGMRPHLWMGGIQLLVRAEDAAQAAELIESQAGAVEDDGES